MHVAADRFTPASLIAAVTRARAPGSLFTRITRSLIARGSHTTVAPRRPTVSRSRPALADAHAAVHADALAVDVARLVGQQERHGVGDIVGCAGLGHVQRGGQV